MAAELDGPEGNDGGDAFVVAPDDGRAGIVWPTGLAEPAVVLAPDDGRWGVGGADQPAGPHPGRADGRAGGVAPGPPTASPRMGRPAVAPEHSSAGLERRAARPLTAAVTNASLPSHVRS